ncbi:MAG: hypothetical protein Q8L55_13255 [Phycisphaerales bacterium]|nr:hypothetical protein [Phycisphaerales bacterium]
MTSKGEPFAVWNTLHDGTIDAISGVVPGDVLMTIGIEYLCRVLPTAAVQLNLHLRSCTLLRYAPFLGVPMEGVEALAGQGIEILSAACPARVVEIACASGHLSLEYEEVVIQLVEGRIISQEELESAAERYWREWERENRS